MREGVLHDAFGADAELPIGAGRLVEQGARGFVGADGAGRALGDVFDAHGPRKVLTRATPGAVLKFVPEFEEEYIVAPVAHLLLEVFRAAIDAAEAFQSADPLKFGLVFFGDALNGASDGGREAYVGFEGRV